MTTGSPGLLSTVGHPRWTNGQHYAIPATVMKSSAENLPGDQPLPSQGHVGMGSNTHGDEDALTRPIVPPERGGRKASGRLPRQSSSPNRTTPAGPFATASSNSASAETTVAPSGAGLELLRLPRGLPSASTQARTSDALHLNRKGKWTSSQQRPASDGSQKGRRLLYLRITLVPPRRIVPFPELREG